MKNFSESRTRSLFKAISWRVWGTMTTALVVFVFSKKWELAILAGGFDFLVKIGLYFVHERIWELWSFGRQEMPGCVIWVTGLPASGKTSLAEALMIYLKNQGRKVEMLDGDEIRKIMPQVGFSQADRNRHVEWAGYLASRFEQQGVIVIAALVSPYAEARRRVRTMCKNYKEVYLSTPLNICEARDPKGLYKKARAGEIQNFTGVSDPYEAPLNAEIQLDMSNLSIADGVRAVAAALPQLTAHQKVLQ